MGFLNKKDNGDSLSQAMQDEIIKISSHRLGYSLSKELIAKVRKKKWSYIGLEMIIETVNNIEVSEIENYLSRLD